MSNADLSIASPKGIRDDIDLRALAVGASSCSSAPEIVHAFQDYYESRGGSCETL